MILKDKGRNSKTEQNVIKQKQMERQDSGGELILEIKRYSL